MSAPVVLPRGSYVLLRTALNLPGIGTSRKWTANELATPTANCVQHIVRDGQGYYLCIPTGAHAGWYHIPFTEVEMCRVGAIGVVEPPGAAADVVAKRRAEIKAETEQRDKASAGVA